MTRHSPVDLRRHIDDVLCEVRKSQGSTLPHPFLGVIEESLEHMKKNVRAKKVDRESMAGALGRIMTEDNAFSESELGDRIFEVINEFAGESENS